MGEYTVEDTIKYLGLLVVKCGKEIGVGKIQWVSRKPDQKSIPKFVSSLSKVGVEKG
tara:strand:- start:362 stop:532 length:171 start_codon:yes stop_codon:yes gene_type:complete